MFFELTYDVLTQLVQIQLLFFHFKWQFFSYSYYFRTFASHFKSRYGFIK